MGWKGDSLNIESINSSFDKCLDKKRIILAMKNTM